MGVLIELPNVEYFETLPHICKAATTFKSLDAEALVQEVGAIFVKHNVFDEFGLALVHRHFDMTQEEVLVETFNKEENISVALPWSIRGNTAEPGDSSLMEAHELTPGKMIIPQSWAFSDDEGGLVAYEFLSYPCDLSPPPKDFVVELCGALKARGLQALVGIRRLLNLREKNSWETTPEGVRANITHHGLIPPAGLPLMNMIKVVWAFNAAGELRTVAECNTCHNCWECQNRHCYSHNRNTSDKNRSPESSPQ